MGRYFWLKIDGPIAMICSGKAFICRGKFQLLSTDDIAQFRLMGRTDVSDDAVVYEYTAY